MDITNKQDNHHLDKAFLIGFSSLPFDRQAKFVEEQIRRKLFREYMKGLRKNSSASDGTEFPKQLYNPQIYYLWGKYDICAISEVDDLEFASRFFRSYNAIGIKGMDTDHEMVNFDYKVVMGINPLLPAASIDAKAPLPYVLISQLKINSALLIGNGKDLIEAVKEFVRNTAQQYCDESDAILMDFKICESYSYHELVVIITSNSINALWKTVLKVRGIQFSEFFTNPVIKNKINAKEILENSIFYDLPDIKQGDPAKLDPSEIKNHLFESTLSNFGLHFYLYNDPAPQQPDPDDNITNSDFIPPLPPLPNETISFHSRWNIKPGHINSTLKILNTLSDSNDILKFSKMDIVTGRGDLFIEKQVTTTGSKNNNQSLDFPEGYFKQSCLLCKSKQPADAICSHKGLSNHVIDTFTSITVILEPEPNGLDLPFEDEVNHFDIHSNLNDYFVVNHISIKKLSDRMRALWVPKALTEKVMKLVSMYNNAIVNPDMYLFFIELHPYINEIFIKTIDKFYDMRAQKEFHAQTLYTTLDEACQELETAFQNRFYQSYWVSEIPETNTAYSGGVHNLISAYDAGYKAINNAFKKSSQSTAEEKRSAADTSFIFVRSDSTIDASFDGVKMNYLHLIQPLIYCSIISHEACNYAFEKMLMARRSEKKYDSITKRIIRQYALADVPFDLQYDYLDGDRVAEYKKLFWTGNKEAVIAGAETGVEYLKSISHRLDYNMHLYINEQLMRYHIVGRLNFQFAFKKDFKRYSQTFWNYFLQAGHIFLKPGEVDAEDFLALAIRLAIIQFSTAPDMHVEKKEFLDSLPKNFMTETLIDTYASDVYKLVESLFTPGNVFYDWFKEWENIYYELGILMDSDNENKDFDQCKKLVKEYLKDDFCKTGNSESYHKIYAQIESAMRTTDNTANLYLSLFLGFLEISDDLPLIERAILTGIPDIYNPKNINKINIDPIGGTFVIGSKKRKEYLALRVKFLRLLYHLSLIYKKKYMSRIVSRSKKLLSGQPPVES